MAEFFMADRVWVAWQGANAQQLLGKAAAQGVRLQQVRRVGAGYTAALPGADLAKLRTLAQQGSWTLQMTQRRGPGRLLRRLAARPGLLAGMVLFVVCVNLWPHYLWNIDFGTLNAEQSTQLREMLVQAGLREGSLIREEDLTPLRAALAAQSESYGWVSLNFADGCLRVESTPATFGTVRPTPGDVSLYARAGGLVTAMRADSGKAAVQPGQYVAQGQLLVAGGRSDRDGDWVPQGASGRVVAQVQKSYTATVALQAEAELPCGPPTEQLRLCLPGGLVLPRTEPEQIQGYTRQEWQPLQLGRVALPACLYRRTVWPVRRTSWQYSRATAQALALRACRLRLRADFPDAQILSEQRRCEDLPDAQRCTVTYLFCADIAEPGPTVVPEKPKPAE